MKDAMFSSATRPPAFALHHDPWGRLVLTDAQGQQHVGVAPVRAFPITDAEHWISICDAGGRELACIEELSELPAPDRRVLEEEIARREFIPVIRRVRSVSSYLEPAEWDVDTDRGRTQFVLRSEDDVRPLGPSCAMIFDAQGIRYLVPDTRLLDPVSRRAVERYL